jgi:hypothetical protein
MPYALCPMPYEHLMLLRKAISSLHLHSMRTMRTMRFVQKNLVCKSDDLVWGNYSSVINQYGLVLSNCSIMLGGVKQKVRSEGPTEARFFSPN